ncbi:isoleucine--tRNA ligase [Lentiprolixibacter aurantiacus]|uniref:Isoleucine--tRNA ligase n=1 Tax=Lentiprolixibacter aurantiacus TaxID=2993939 RepID=A0AAE3SM39_9FLAO|nr:isoleucine--tRNA ligase [Lentiprolixibacter aurantiacus]MCX2718332.1 isoleucine--tRNA ligase [Lentiprolixibacter aurantiacus]
MKFAEYKGLNLPRLGEEVLDFWKENRIFNKSITSREGKPGYVFYEGPPSANGMPGIHHVMARTIKDIFPRYKTMKGFQVKRKAGWDTHGLPVELGVEKELGITKEDIGTKISIEQYNEACKKAVMRYTDAWNDMTEKIGYWVDMEDPYVTYKSKYMETVWWLLKEIYDKGLLYKGYTIQPYSPKAGTGLSSHELNQPGTYQDITDTTVTAQFRAVKETLPDFLSDHELPVYLLAWTTTPWTLPSNTALTVGEEIDYVLVRTYNQYTFKPIQVILAKNLVKTQFSGKYEAVEEIGDINNFSEDDKKIPYYVLNTFKGKDLLGVRYEQLLTYAQPYQNADNAFRVISGDFVTTEDGTGIVHTAPTFGADDMLVAQKAEPQVPPMLVLDENDNPVPLVDLQGKFRPEMKELGGKYVKNEYYDEGEAPERSVDVELAIMLKEQNKAFKVEKYKHPYPNCWRTDKPILYYPLDSWFIKVTQIKDRMYELNQTINWKPKATGEGRFGNWLANANDWNLSRSRFWGTPLPIWRTEDGKEAMCIGSVSQLKEEMEKAVAAGFMEANLFADFSEGDMSEENYEKVDLHKNIVDKIVLVSDSGRPMHRELDLIDVWFDSGSMPYAQWHYPFENKELIDQEIGFPADFIAEGVDQTRGWFYTLHAIATMVFDSVAYRNVVSNGLVLDKDGKKMSKRLGNAVSPLETVEEYGPDATRWYLISNANPWDNLKFDVAGIEEVKRKFFGTLYNTYAFFALYANIDEFSYKEDDVPLSERPEIDQWILSELHTLIKKVDQAYDSYEPTRAARAMADFVQENLSNWYVRLCRRRFWKGDYGQDKISAYQTLYTCLATLAKLASPIAPFFMERLFLDLNRTTGKEQFESVHLSYFPVYDEAMVNKELESKMQKAQTISSLVLSIRQKEKIKVRQPLHKIMIPVLDNRQREEIEAVSDLILSEVNVKEIELLDDASGILVKKIKPNFKLLGPRYGRDMKAIGQAVAQLGQEDIQKIEREGEIALDLDNKSIILKLEDVEISSQDIEGWLVASSGPITVALDIHVTEELRKEGIARELVNRIQNLRKESGFEVTDKIDIKIQKDGYVEEAVTNNINYIKNETLTAELEFEEQLDEGADVSFDEVNTRLLIKKH